MADITQDDLRAAVAAGHLNEAQAAELATLSQIRAGARQAEDEPFELFRGFSEIFVSVGLGILIFGGFGLALATSVTWVMGVGIICLWLLARYFTLKRRMMLPSILLVSAFGLAILGIAADRFDFWLPGTPMSRLLTEQPGATAWLMTFGIVIAALLLWYRVFRVPFTMFLVGIAAFGAVMMMATASGAQSGVTNPFDLTEGGLVSWGTLAVGLAALIAGTWFDMRDPHRLGRTSASGFWLHIVAAGALVHTVAQTCMGMGPGTGYGLMGLALLVIALLALILDRRSFLTAGIGYFIFLLSYVTDVSGTGGNWVFVFLFIGLFLTLLGSFWIQVRGALLRALPGFPGKDRLPPYRTEIS
ncbi:hypothetical protein [Pseudooceanicola algae]|uniref:DUF2157 domain-containing protein n=1 Tax=Pseudooceanicola algae TaxID=1537215 RepID=A0A418SBJ0_9RHOB|nr:hypothetical protein [Pseudooceanicola algae]QPM91488.1 hypothetical protein PSAL_027410 [Pseudooceanicola algae]